MIEDALTNEIDRTADRILDLLAGVVAAARDSSVRDRAIALLALEGIERALQNPKLKRRAGTRAEKHQTKNGGKK